MSKAARIFGSLLIVAGVLTLAWAVLVWRWQDPFTALYTHFQQARLSSTYEKRAAAFRPRVIPGGDLASVQREVASEARAYRRALRTGDPVGRLRIGRIGLNMVVVQGTDHESLKKGPGHYSGSALPGEGHLIYIAGHRTTYLAPFAAINNIRVGDYITFELPYGTFTYRTTRHSVVTADDVAALEDEGMELLRLQACHPRFFATHRYLVDAKLVSVQPRGGAAYTPVKSANS
ncbi:MAG: sortase [Gaiellaceae bacterium]